MYHTGRLYTDIVTLGKLKHKKITTITTGCGVIYRKETFMKHLSSEYHNKIIIAYLKKIEGIKQSDTTPLANYISKANGS